MPNYDGKAATLLLRGGEIVAPEVVEESMQIAAADLQAEIGASMAMQGEFGTSGQAMRDLVAAGASETALEAHRARANAIRAQRPAVAAIMPPEPPMIAQEPFAYTGSIGGVETPNYDYKWTWFRENGIVASHNETVNDPTPGRMHIQHFLDGDSRQEERIDAAVGLGFYFRPPTKRGFLQIDARPALQSTYVSVNNLSTTTGKSWVGTYIGEYIVGTNTFNQTMSDHRETIFSDSSFWIGHNFNKSTSGHPLMGRSVVSGSHWYAIWVWCGMTTSNAGDGTFGSAVNINALTVNVPSITWALL